MNAPPPDMTRENAAELKQLQRQLIKHEATSRRDLRRILKRIENVDLLISREDCRLIREANRKLKVFIKPLMVAQNAARREKRRHLDGRTPGHKAVAAIKARIAILEGRLGS